jgi:hypothetical protein
MLINYFITTNALHCFSVFCPYICFGTSCAIIRVPSTVHNPQCNQFTFTTYNFCKSLSLSQYTIHSTQYTVHKTQYTIHSTQYTVHSTQYTIHSTQYTVHNTQYTIHNTQYTIHNTQYTVHSTQQHAQQHSTSTRSNTITQLIYVANCRTNLNNS